MRLRCLIALSLAVAAAVVGYEWPISPRLTLQPERGGWYMAFSPDGTMLALLDREPSLNQPAQTRTGFKVCFAPDRKTLAVVDFGGVLLWDLPPPSRWPLAVELGVLAASLPFAGRALRRCARGVARL